MINYVDRRERASAGVALHADPDGWYGDFARPRVYLQPIAAPSVLGLLGSPLGAALSRRWERQADAFSLELTRDLETFESTHRRLALSNLADLDPPRLLYLAWFSHPTPPERITAAQAIRIPAPHDQTTSAY